MPRITKTDRIGQLEAQIKHNLDLIDDAQKFRDAIARELGLSSHRDLDVFLDQIKDLRMFKVTREGAENARISTLENENARLWYLMRVHADDNTLIERSPNDPISNERNIPPFNRPRF